MHKLLKTFAFLNNPDNRLMHRDLRPSQVYVKTSREMPEPMIYHIGFMQGCEANEKPECDGMWVAPEVVCGSSFMSSDSWSIGSITYRLCAELISSNLFTELKQNPMFGGSDRQQMIQFVQSPKELFTAERLLSDSYVPKGMLPLQTANNAISVAAMVAVAKDAIVDRQTRRCHIVKEGYFENFAKDAKVRQIEAFVPAKGMMPWDDTITGIPRSGRLEVLKKYGLPNQIADFIQACWVFDPNKRPKAEILLKQKWFAGMQ